MESQIKWKTRSGEEIPVDEMEDSHVENTINLILKKGGIKFKRELLKHLIQIKNNEAKRRQRNQIIRRLGGVPHGELASEDHDRMMIDDFEEIDFRDIGFNPDWD